MVQPAAERGIVQLIYSAAGQHDDVQTRQLGLAKAEAFSNLPLDPVAVYCQAYVFLGNDQAKPRWLLFLAAGQNENFPAGDLEISPVKDLLVVF